MQAVDLEGFAAHNMHQATHFERRRAPLHCASYGGFLDCMSVIIANGANLNLQDNEVRGSRRA